MRSGGSGLAMFAVIPATAALTALLLSKRGKRSGADEVRRRAGCYGRLPSLLFRSIRIIIVAIFPYHQCTQIVWNTA